MNNQELSQIIEDQLKNWPNNFNGDTNLIDVYALSIRTCQSLNLELQIFDIDIKAGIEIVEIIETNFIKGVLLRNRSSDDILESINNSLEVLKTKNNLKDISDINKIVISLLIWHGCINMSKTLRKTYVTFSGEKEYTVNERSYRLSYIKNHFEQNNNNNSYWIKYGVKLSKPFSQNRGNSIVDNWVPKDSVYWEFDSLNP